MFLQSRGGGSVGPARHTVSCTFLKSQNWALKAREGPQDGAPHFAVVPCTADMHGH